MYSGFTYIEDGGFPIVMLVYQRARGYITSVFVEAKLCGVETWTEDQLDSQNMDG